MRVLIIGTGSIGRRHMTNLRQLVPGVAFDVLREGRSPDVSALGDVSVSLSLDEAISKCPQLMVIASPSSMHLRYILAAIDHGVPFYAEKPVVTSEVDLRILQQRVQTKTLPPNIVGCNLRFLPSLRRMRALVCEGALGHVVRASFEAGQWLADWRPTQDYRSSYSASRNLGGGVLLDLIHEVDAARWFLGEFTSVQAQMWRGSSLDIETEDCACLLLRAESGSLVTVQLDYVSRRPFRRYRVVGDLATAEWDLPTKTLTLSTVDGVQTMSLEASAFEVGGTYIDAMSSLLYAIEHGTRTEQALEEGLASLDIVMRAHSQSSLPT